MAYERYIKKGGKIYGPYTYHSKKRDGKVVSEYIGRDIDEAITKKKKTFLKKISLLFGVLFILIASAVLILMISIGITGKVSLEIQDNYKPGEQIIGSVKLNLKNGELLPANTKIIVDNAGATSEFLLSELIYGSTEQGNFYIENKEITGSGLGYGVMGEKTAYPEVDFILRIIKSEEETQAPEEQGTQTTAETTQEQISVSEETTTQETAPEITQEATETKEKSERNKEKKTEETTTSETTEITQEATITGESISETITEIQGKVSKNNPYTYALSQGETAEIISSSKDVKLKIKDNIAEITTDYEEKESGFGKNYLTNQQHSISIELSRLNLIAQEGELSVKLVYAEQELVSASKKISVEQQVEGEKLEKEINATGIIIKKNETELKKKQEKQAIIQENVTAGNETINATIGNLSIDTTQFSAVIGKPVKWNKKVKVDVGAGEIVQNLSLTLPNLAGNISVWRIDKITNEEVELQIETQNENIISETEPVVGVTGAFIKGITGRVVDITETDEDVNVEIKEEIYDNDEFIVEYYTNAPYAQERAIGKNNKEIVVIGPDKMHYENVLAFSELPYEIKNSGNIKLYHVNNNSKQPAGFNAIDTNNNSLIDYIEWIVPSLSNQTYEIEIVILNVQSYPTVGGVWEVRFTTIGSADLWIRAVDGTTWSNENENNDLKFLEAKCGENLLTYEWINDSVFITDYYCNKTGSEKSKVITQGKHHLEFEFGGQKAYAHNTASGPIPQTLNLHGRLTNSTGSILNGTYNMTFRIWDGADAGAGLLWTSANQSVIVDSNGVYNVILSNVNISFDGDYYLGITVTNDSEMTPRINLTSTPYTFRANITDYLNPSRNYQVANFTANYYFGNGSFLTGLCLSNGTGCIVSSDNDTLYYAVGIYIYNNGSNYFFLNETQLNNTINSKNSGFLNLSGANANQDINISPYNFQAGNLTLSDKITFRLGEIIDNLVDGFITITGGLNVTQNISASWFKGNLNWSDVQNAPTSDWLSTYNATYDAKVSFNNTNLAYLNNSQTFTANQTINGSLFINSQAVGQKGLVIKGATSQTANWLESQNSSGNIINRWGATENTFNEQGSDNDFRVEGVGQPYNFYIDASTNTVWIDLASGSDITANNMGMFKVKGKFNPINNVAHTYGGFDGVVRIKGTNYAAGSNFNALNFQMNVEEDGGTAVGSANLNLNFMNVGDFNYGGDLTLQNVTGLKHFHQQSNTFGIPNIVATNWYTVLSEAPVISAGSLTLTNRYGTYMADYVGATITNQYGHYIEKQTAGGTTNAGIVLAGDGVGADIVLGAGQDAKIFWDGNNLVFNTTAVSSGNATFTGGVNLLSGKNFSVGSNVGLNGNYTMGSCWVYFTGGIATATNCTSA